MTIQLEEALKAVKKAIKGDENVLRRKCIKVLNERQRRQSDVKDNEEALMGDKYALKGNKDILKGNIKALNCNKKYSSAIKMHKGKSF